MNYVPNFRQFRFLLFLDMMDVLMFGKVDGGDVRVFNPRISRHSSFTDVDEGWEGNEIRQSKEFQRAGAQSDQLWIVGGASHPHQARPYSVACAGSSM